MISILIATLALGTVAAPAVEPDVPVAAAVPAPAATPAASAKTRYCIVNRLTGSRIAKRTCRTRAEWLGEGFDPAAK